LGLEPVSLVINGLIVRWSGHVEFREDT